MTYQITIQNPCLPTVTHTRARRDGAEYLFRRCVFDVLKSRALLDRPIARSAMEKAEEASLPDCAELAVYVQDVTIRFRRGV